MGRKELIPSDAKLVLAGAEPQSRLQADSLRRAIVNRVVDTGGVTTIAALDEHFAIETRPTVMALIRTGWLREAA